MPLHCYVLNTSDTKVGYFFVLEKLLYICARTRIPFYANILVCG